MQIIPTQAVPSQQINVILGSQFCTINVYQKSTGLYLDLVSNSVSIINGVLCQDRNRLVRDAYLGFIGDLAFIDNEGTSDPDYTGLASRYSLAYIEPSDVV